MDAEGVAARKRKVRSGEVRGAGGPKGRRADSAAATTAGWSVSRRSASPIGWYQASARGAPRLDSRNDISYRRLKSQPSSPRRFRGERAPCRPPPILMNDCFLPEERMSMPQRSRPRTALVLAAAIGIAGAGDAARAAMCNTSTQPSLHDISLAIAPNNNQFISDYNTLSEAAWCTFIALSWPAQGTSPTMTGSSTMKIGQGLGTTPLVWETWLDSTQVYCSNGNPPGQCGGAAAFKEVRNGKPFHRVKAANPNTAHFAVDRIQGLIKAGHKISPRLQKLAVTSDTSNDLSENVQATGFMLPDKNNNKSVQSVILYEVRENPATVTFLTQKGFYNRNGQTTYYNAQGGTAMPPS